MKSNRNKEGLIRRLRQVFDDVNRVLGQFCLGHFFVWDIKSIVTEGRGGEGNCDPQNKMLKLQIDVRRVQTSGWP